MPGQRGEFSSRGEHLEPEIGEIPVSEGHSLYHLDLVVDPLCKAVGDLVVEVCQDGSPVPFEPPAQCDERLQIGFDAGGGPLVEVGFGIRPALEAAEGEHLLLEEVARVEVGVRLLQLLYAPFAHLVDAQFFAVWGGSSSRHTARPRACPS